MIVDGFRAWVHSTLAVRFVMMYLWWCWCSCKILQITSYNS